MADEFETMKSLEETVLALESEKRPRVLQWFWSRFGDELGATKSSALRMSVASMSPSAGGGKYDTFADLFDAASPQTEREKALVAAFWVQVCQNEQSFPSQVLNGLLKDLGHGIGNITEALTQLKEERPALVLQLKKSGLSKQARKTYKLTQEGIRRIEMMTRQSSDGRESE
jgi:hypothetical protein